MPPRAAFGFAVSPFTMPVPSGREMRKWPMFVDASNPLGRSQAGVRRIMNRIFSMKESMDPSLSTSSPLRESIFSFQFRKLNPQ